ncbi:MAG: DHH family phosphoesterase [Clostridia bacterium]|nr:DHH family phosphoesterase [Clostridia bacterium]
MRKIKFNDVFVPKYRTYLIIILILLITGCLASPSIPMLFIALIIYAGVLFFTYRKNNFKKERVINYMDSFIFKLKTDESILNFPIPAVIITESGDILWNNDSLELMFKGINKQKFLENIIKELDEEYDDRFAEIDKEINIHDKHYRILGNLVNLKKRNGKETVMMLYFIDRTEYYRLFKSFEDSKDCVGIIVIDNYEELFQGMSDTDMPQLVALLEKQLREWMAFTGGIITRMDRSRFLIIFDKKFIKAFTESKFEILDSVKEIKVGNKIPLTISMGIITDDGTKNEKFQSAIAAIDVALSRGGDQVVIKKDGKYNFFGGNSKEVEKRTRVKSRVIAQGLQELIMNASSVVIMGHKNMDADCLGSAMGMYILAKSYEKEAHVVFNKKGVAIDELVRKIVTSDKLSDVIVSEEELLPTINEDTLLIVVDTHKIDLVESQAILNKVNKVAIIDHHRRGTEAIENAILTFQEVYASSASELVTEILQYSELKIEIPTLVAECLYAGILTDTKNFTQKTGVRTFEAAAYLKKLGVDVAMINKLFQNDVDTYVSIADVIRNSEILFGSVAIAICPKGLENQIQITAQAADELLNLNSIDTSFVLSEVDDKVYISGRSNGKVNVQMVLEKLGGGGHMMIAGAQVQGMSVEEVKKMLIGAIEETIKNNE